MLVVVRDNKVEAAYKILKRRMQKAMIYEKLKIKHHITGTEKKALKNAKKRKTISKFLKLRNKKEG